jgi:hypothetical protein
MATVRSGMPSSASKPLAPERFVKPIIDFRCLYLSDSFQSHFSFAFERNDSGMDCTVRSAGLGTNDAAVFRSAGG